MRIYYLCTKQSMYRRMQIYNTVNSSINNIIESKVLNGTCSFYLYNNIDRLSFEILFTINYIINRVIFD